MSTPNFGLPPLAGFRFFRQQAISDFLGARTCSTHAHRGSGREDDNVRPIDDGTDGGGRERLAAVCQAGVRRVRLEQVGREVDEGVRAAPFASVDAADEDERRPACEVRVCANSEALCWFGLRTSCSAAGSAAYRTGRNCGARPVPTRSGTFRICHDRGSGPPSGVDRGSGPPGLPRPPTFRPMPVGITLPPSNWIRLRRVRRSARASWRTGR